ncbi:MAG: HD domain-containing protein [Gemmatimonadetes bacterium]|nr:HD domain-containing protein [Gemmatimonadota bacterium]
MSRSRTIRDPLWGNIHVDADAADLLDTAPFQRLRRVKQLGFTHLVYPGGAHSRFLHALGVYHLVGRAVHHLEQNGQLERLDSAEREALPIVRLAALLHDVGHYAFSHAMEELAPASIPGDHAEMARHFLEAEPIREVLERYGPGALDDVAELIRGTSRHPLQGLVAGSLDLDKIDYLRRDALFCGVPYGAVDVDRLLAAFTLANEDDGPLELAVTTKGISALETLLFSKYQMFRNVYWHHAVRAATATFVRLVEGALRNGLLSREELAGPSDEELLALIAARIEALHAGSAIDPASSVARVESQLSALIDRRLPKRVVELTGDRLPDRIASWPSRRPDLVSMLEKRLAGEWGAPEGSIIVDYPSYPGMLELNVLLVRRDRAVRRLTTLGERGLIDVPRIGRSLHHSARVLRVFSFEPVGERGPEPILELIEASETGVEERLAAEEPLYV